MTVKVFPQMPCLGLRFLAAGPRSPFPFPFPDLGSNRVTWCFSGRTAIYHSFKALGISPQGEVLMPAYHCGAEVAAVEAAGLKPVFYTVGVDLSIDVARLEALVSASTRAIYLTHFFGFPGPVDEIADLVRRNSLPLIEDCAQALYSRFGDRPLGSWGDASVFSLTKSLPLPDGGLLALGGNRYPYLASLNSPPARETVKGLKRLLLYKIRRSLRMREETVVRVGNGFGSETKESGPLDEVLLGSGCSRVTKTLLKRSVWQRVVTARRENYHTLLRALSQVLDKVPDKEARPLKGVLDRGVVPWVFPVVVRNPYTLTRLLRMRGVGAFVVWGRFHPRFSSRLFPEAARLKQSILALPVHQGLAKSDMIPIAEIFAETVKADQWK